MMQSNCQVVISNSIFEIYQRDGWIRYGHKIKKRRKKKTGTKSPQEQLNNRLRSRSRSKQDLIRLINSNVYAYSDDSGRPYMPIFLTLTFPEKINDTQEANYMFTKLIQKLNYMITNQKLCYLKYVAVIEFHKKGGIHYHVLFFNLPFRRDIKKELGKLWPGFSKIKGTKNIENLGFYLSKYMSKGAMDDRLDGKKIYFSSRGLKKPQVVRFANKHFVSEILGHMPTDSLRFEKVFDQSEYCPRTEYKQFNLCKHEEEKREILLLVENAVKSSQLTIEERMHLLYDKK